MAEDDDARAARSFREPVVEGQHQPGPHGAVVVAAPDPRRPPPPPAPGVPRGQAAPTPRAEPLNGWAVTFNWTKRLSVPHGPPRVRLLLYEKLLSKASTTAS